MPLPGGKREWRRRLTSPPSPRLEQLVGGAGRVHTQRQDAETRRCALLLRCERQHERQRQRERFLARWHHVRGLYAAVSELVGPRAPAADAADAPRALATLTAMAWLQDVACAFHQAFPTPRVTVEQLQIAVCAALRLTAPSSARQAVLVRLQRVFRAFQDDDDAQPATADYRQLLSALAVLDRWREGERKLLARWFHEFAFAARSGRSTGVAGGVELAVLASDVARMLGTACASDADEQRLQPFVAELLALQPPGRALAQSRLDAYVATRPALLQALRTQCWARLTDDTRLRFYRHVYVHARARFAQEEARARVQDALALWRMREPRARLERWKIFVVERRLRHAARRHFRTRAGRRAVRLLRRHAAHRRHARARTRLAHAHRSAVLVRSVWRPWTLFRRSMALLHEAARRRSERHERHVRRARGWRGWRAFYAAASARNLQLDALVAAQLARKAQKVLRACVAAWLQLRRREAEVAAADARAHTLHTRLALQAALAHERGLMTAEDAASGQQEAQARVAAELTRQRSFQEASRRAEAQRKLLRQQERRTQSKALRTQHAEHEAQRAWAAIAAQAAVEVRAAALRWLASDAPDAREQVRREAARLFERDEKLLRDELLRDPERAPGRLMPAGCRWQLFLEDVSAGQGARRLPKAFYLNADTYAKFWCDELVLDDCEAIAKEVLVQQRIDAAMERLRDKQRQRERLTREHAAATRIQLLFRGRQALQYSRRLLRACLVKRVDPSSGGAVYFNVDKPHESRRRPPMLLGRDEPLLSVESSTWVYREDEQRAPYYARVDTGETRPGPPDHYVLCAQCERYLATRRHVPTGARYCVSCYATRRLAAKAERSAEEDGAWVKLPVQPASCVACRVAPADWLCADCKGDALCARCFRAVHASARTAKTPHAPPAPLVNRG